MALATDNNFDNSQYHNSIKHNNNANDGEITVPLFTSALFTQQQANPSSTPTVRQRAYADPPVRPSLRCPRGPGRPWSVPRAAPVGPFPRVQGLPRRRGHGCRHRDHRASVPVDRSVAAAHCQGKSCACFWRGKATEVVWKGVCLHILLCTDMM